MKTRYKIVVIAICAYFGVFFGPVITSNVYCDFIAEEMCTSRITGVSLPPLNMIPLSMPNDNECFFENAEGVMVPCYIETGYFDWPFPPRIHEYEHDRNCDEICVDDETYKPSIEQLRRVLNHCESQRKLATGETPERNADGSYNVINAIGLSYDNGTHYIDNNTCEWQKVK